MKRAVIAILLAPVAVALPTAAAHAAYFEGTTGNDYIVGTGSADHIDTKGGNDIIVPGTGLDLIHAGPGNDIVVISSDGAADQISCGKGRDKVQYNNVIEHQDRIYAQTHGCEEFERI